MFPQAVEKTLFALLISQLTFIGYTLIRKGVFQVRLQTNGIVLSYDVYQVAFSHQILSCVSLRIRLSYSLLYLS